MVGRTVVGSKNVEMERVNSSTAGRAPLPASRAATGQFFTHVERPSSMNPSIASTMPHVEAIEEVRDVQKRAGDGLGGAGRAGSSCCNLPRNPVSDALLMLDSLPERGTTCYPEWDVHLEDGEVWEKGPESVVREGYSIRSIYSQFASGPATSQQICPSAPNAALSRPPGAVSSSPTARDGLAEGQGGGGHGPARSLGAGELLVTGALAAQAVHAVQPDRVFKQISGSTEFDTDVSRPGDQGGMREGNGDFVSRVVRRSDVDGSRNAAPDNVATCHCVPAAADCQQTPVVGQSTAWGRPPGPSQLGYVMGGCIADPGSVGGWSPDYHEAFPSLRVEDGATGTSQIRRECGDVRQEAEGEATRKNVSLTALSYIKPTIIDGVNYFSRS